MSVTTASRRLGGAFLVATIACAWFGLGASHAPSAAAQLPISTQWTGQFDLGLSCTSGGCAGKSATAQLDLVQSGSAVTGTVTNVGGSPEALGVSVGPVNGQVQGRRAALYLADAVGGAAIAKKGAGPRASVVQLALSPDGKAVRGLWDDGANGGSGAVTGSHEAAASTAAAPSWAGHWTTVLGCANQTCDRLTSDGTLELGQSSLDLVQNGNEITGTATSVDDSTTGGLSGTASGLSATLTSTASEGDGSVTTTANVTLSADGTTFSGTMTGLSSVEVSVTGAREGKAALGVLVSPNVPLAGLGVRRAGEVSVQVTAVGGAVDGISLGKGLTVSEPALEVTSTPGGLSGFSLESGKSKTFTFAIKGLKGGVVTVGADASGTDRAGAAVTASGSAPVKVGGAQLAMTVSSTPDSLSIRKGASGQARTVTVRVRMRNTGKEPVEHVQLLSLFPNSVDHTQVLKKLQFTETFPRSVGTIAPGAVQTETFKLDATGGFGRYEVEALALFDDPTAQGGNGRAFATGPVFDVVTTEATKVIDFTFNGAHHTLYYDPATGALLGALPYTDPLSKNSEVFFYNAATGALDLRDPVTGQSYAVTFEPASQKVTIADPGVGEAGVLHYNAKTQALEIVDAKGAVITEVLFDQKTGKFRTPVVGP